MAIQEEAERLYEMLSPLGWSRRDCEAAAIWTTRIRELARRQKAVILGHSYMVPEVQFGVADHRGDSLGLSRIARETDAEVIVFCGVRFMAETAKVLSPDKRVLLPAPDAGCSLSESITGEDVRRLRRQHPDAAFVCYVNTSAEVKAECDVVCTSANALAVVEGVPEQEVVFLPDRYMAQNLQAMTRKRIIGYPGRCLVHETFDAPTLLAWKSRFPNARVLVHTESPEEVVGLADLAGGTGDMVRYVRESEAREFLVVTECGLADRLRSEFPEKRFLGSCVLCPHMKRVHLRNVLQVLQDPRPDQVVEVPGEVAERARRAIDRMFEITGSQADGFRPHSHGGEAAGRCD